MKILFTATEGDWNADLDDRFGRARGFAIYDEDSDAFSWHSNELNQKAMQGAGIQAAQIAADSGARVVITGHVGPKAFNLLDKVNIKVFQSSERSLKEAYDAFRNGKLVQQVH